MAQKLKVKKGDKVIVIAGGDKGKKGEIIKVFPAEGKVIVSGVAVATRHQKAQMMKQSGLVKKERAIDISNVMLTDSEGKPTRVGRRLKDGKTERYAKTTKENLN